MVVVDDNNDYHETILGRRSPIKHNAFFRTSHSSTRNKKWCPGSCGRELVYFKEASAWACTECGHTEYIEQKKKEQQVPTIIDSSSGIGSVDGLSDSHLQPNRGATKFRHMDPRKRFLKPKSQLDPELQKLVDEQGVTIVRYEERIEQSNDVVTSEQLRANK